VAYPKLNSSGTALGQCTDALPGGNVQDFSYGFNLGSADNGNLASLVATGTASTQTFSRVYGYDALNRLLTMTAPGDACSGLSWSYDAWGNRTDQTQTGGTCFAFHAAADTNNRLVGYSYDAAGNMTSDGNHTYTYDAENRIIAVDNGAATYKYDALGRRTSKMIGTSFADYGYDLAGNPITEVEELVWRADVLGHRVCLSERAIAGRVCGRDHLLRAGRPPGLDAGDDQAGPDGAGLDGLSALRRADCGRHRRHPQVHREGTGQRERAG
jgi:YD repeat-containing protein